jgi:hypothetical protein
VVEKHDGLWGVFCKSVSDCQAGLF